MDDDPCAQDELASGAPDDQDEVESNTISDLASKEDMRLHALQKELEQFISAQMEKYNTHSHSRMAQPHPNLLANTLEELSRPLFKLVSLTTGRAHARFPKSVFQYHLLTSDDLDHLARYYHQIWPPTPETYRYPKPMMPWIGTIQETTLDIEAKRCRFGRFIGWKRDSDRDGDVDIPAEANFAIISTRANGDPRTSLTTTFATYSAEEVRNMMEREWEEALRRALQEGSSRGFVGYTKSGF